MDASFFFDAVEESRRAKREISREIQGMTFEEMRAYFQKGIEEMYGKEAAERYARKHAVAMPAPAPRRVVRKAAPALVPA